MDAKLLSSFWSDAHIGALTPEQKLAVVWTLTSRDRNSLGFVKASARQFLFDTGLELVILLQAVKALSRTFMVQETEAGLSVLSLSFVSYQFGDLVGAYNHPVHKHLVTELHKSEEWVKEALLKRYEGLRKGYEALLKRYALLVNGKEGFPNLPEPQEQRREERSKAFFEVPSDLEVFQFASTWPGEPSSGAPKMPLEFVTWWIARVNERAVGWPKDWRRAIVADWRQKFPSWRNGKNTAPEDEELKSVKKLFE